MAGVKRFGVLEGERLRLRPLTDTDFELYAALYGDDNILRYIGSALEQHALEKSFVKAVQLNTQEPCKRAFLVAELLDNMSAGILGLTVTEDTKRIEVGVIFKPEYQKHHLAFEALQVLISFLCNQYVEYNIIAEVQLDNRAAVWLAKRLGFRYNNESGLFELDKQNRPAWGT